MTKCENPDYVFSEDGMKADIVGFYKTMAGALRAANKTAMNEGYPSKFYTRVYLLGINDEIEYDEEMLRWYNFRNCMF
jgi:hypothetical protein